MTDPAYICPQPIPWNDIHRKLSAFHAESCPDASTPPIPLILAGWAYSNDEEKASRWQSTVTWAEKHGASHLIPELAEGERHLSSTYH